MRSVALLFFVLGCSVQQDLGPAVTCPDVSASNNAGECDIVANSPCSDTAIYEIDCGDDGTCTCARNGMYSTSVIASDQASGYCDGFDVSRLHDLAADCGWNLNQ